MSGKVLRCDHDGCDAVYPPAPVAGWGWPIRAEAEKAGWKSTRSGLYNVDHDPDRSVQDFCPKHTSDLTSIRLHTWKRRLDDVKEAGEEALVVTRAEYRELQDLARDIERERLHRHAEALMSIGVDPPVARDLAGVPEISALFGTPVVVT